MKRLKGLKGLKGLKRLKEEKVRSRAKGAGHARGRGTRS